MPRISNAMVQNIPRHTGTASAESESKNNKWVVIQSWLSQRLITLNSGLKSVTYFEMAYRKPFHIPVQSRLNRNGNIYLKCSE